MNIQYEIEFKSASWWLEKAEGHKFSSEIINEKLVDYQIRNRNTFDDEDEERKFMSLIDSAMLLYGLAFENILKAYVISRLSDITQKSKYISEQKNWSRNHKLINLVDKNSITITKEERIFIENLEKYLRWQGKYHLPTNDTEDPIQIYYEGLFVKLNLLYEKLKIEVNENMNRNETRYNNWIDSLK